MFHFWSIGLSGSNTPEVSWRSHLSRPALQEHAGHALAALLVASLLCACSAQPPKWRDGQLPGIGSGNYATEATCTPPGACPGPGCAEQVIGAPDSLSVDLNTCTTLDVTFTGGEVVARTLAQAGDAELLVHLGAPVTGLTRIEASSDGLEYTIIGYLASSSQLLPARTKDTCLADIVEDKAYLYLGRCNSIDEVSALRLINDPFVAEAAAVDAIEALSFKPLSKS